MALLSLGMPTAESLSNAPTQTDTAQVDDDQDDDVATRSEASSTETRQRPRRRTIVAARPSDRVKPAIGLTSLLTRTSDSDPFHNGLGCPPRC
jgi:hypothetical protein